MNLFLKTRDHTLYACANGECVVSTFIREMECPVCHHPGTLIREPYDGRGAPGWLKKN